MRFFILQILSQQLAVVEALIDTKSAFLFKKKLPQQYFCRGDVFRAQHVYK